MEIILYGFFCVAEHFDTHREQAAQWILPEHGSSELTPGSQRRIRDSNEISSC